MLSVVTLWRWESSTSYSVFDTKIDVNRLTNSPMVQLYNSLIPAPTQNNPTGSNFAFTQTTPQTYRDYTGRIDYKFSSKDNLFVRHTRADYTKGQNDYTVGGAGGKRRTAS